MAKKTNFTTSSGKRKFRVTATVGFDENGKRIRKQFYGESKKEAETKRDDYLSDVKNGLDMNYEQMKFGDLFTEWFNVILTPEIAQSTYARYESLIRNHLKPAAFYNMKISTIKSIDIKKHLNQLESKHTAAKIYQLLLSFFTFAQKERIIMFSPMEGVLRPKQEKEIKKEFLSNTDIKTMIPFCTDTNFIYAFALFTGLRQGEILALTHNDIDFENKEISVTKTLNRFGINGKTQIVITKPKTKSSIRKVPLLDDLIPLLKEHMVKEKEKHLKLGLPFSKETYLFTLRCCSPLRADRLGARWKAFQEELGIEPCKFHGLRHTFCTILATKNVPLKTAAVIMGHTNINTTAKIYAHVDAEEKQRAINSLKGIITQ
jgi:integrase